MPLRLAYFPPRPPEANETWHDLTQCAFSWRRLEEVFDRKWVRRHYAVSLVP
jgi:hypothetical protein